MIGVVVGEFVTGSVGDGVNQLQAHTQSTGTGNDAHAYVGELGDNPGGDFRLRC